MEWVRSLFSGESGTAMQLVAITLALVVVLILVVWLFRRIAGAPTRRASKDRVPRLSITDVAAVDEKRFLVLARRDNVEHLLLIGGPSDVLVESGIEHAAPVGQPQVADPQSHAEQALKADENRAREPEDVMAPAALAVGSAMAAANDTSDPADNVAAASSEELEVAAPDAEPVTEEAADVHAEPELPQEAPVAQHEPAAVAEEAPDHPVADVEPEEEVRIETAISENLGDALNMDEIEVVEAAPEPEVQEIAANLTAQPSQEEVEPESELPDAPTDDEMQKLLDELAGEKKASGE